MDGSFQVSYFRQMQFYMAPVAVSDKIISKNGVAK